jgi:hypothetical protein
MPKFENDTVILEFMYVYVRFYVLYLPTRSLNNKQLLTWIDWITLRNIEASYFGSVLFLSSPTRFDHESLRWDLLKARATHVHVMFTHLKWKSSTLLALRSKNIQFSTKKNKKSNIDLWFYQNNDKSQCYDNPLYK